MTPKLRRYLRRKRNGNAGWAIIVVFLGLAIFAFIMIELTTVAGYVNTWTSTQPGFTASYDPASNSAVDALFFTGLAVMVAFAAVPEIINASQKRTSGEEVI